MSYRSNYRSIFSGLGQTSKTATTSTSSTSKSGSSTQPDRTAQDWATALQTGGPLVSSIIGAATGQQQPQTPASTEPTIDPNTALAPAPATPSWYWPVVIGVGGALLAGIVFVGYTAKKPVKPNKRFKNKAHRARARRRSRSSQRKANRYFRFTQWANKDIDPRSY